MADKIRLLIVGAAIALALIFCATQTYMDFMWMKAIVFLSLALVYKIIVAFWGPRPPSDQ